MFALRVTARKEFKPLMKYCFNSFFILSHKKGCQEELEPWRVHWSASCRKDAPLKLFMQEEIVPFWVQCNECEKWREIPDTTFHINKEFNETFVCSEVILFIFYNLVGYIHK